MKTSLLSMEQLDRAFAHVVQHVFVEARAYGMEAFPYVAVTVLANGAHLCGKNDAQQVCSVCIANFVGRHPSA